MNLLRHELIPAPSARSKRLFVLLHGLAGTMEGLRWVPDALSVPWLNYLLVNAPDPYYCGFAWYDFAGGTHSGLQRSGEMLSQLLRIQEQNGFLPENTIIGGFSQGCVMSLELGLRYPRKLAGIVGVSGYVADPQKLLTELSPVARSQRVFITHGKMDPIVPFNVVKQQVHLLKTKGLNIQWHELEKPHTIGGEFEVNLIRDFILSCWPDGVVKNRRAG